MQTRAILEAAAEVKEETGITPHPEIMIPFVGHVNELFNQAQVVGQVASEVAVRQKVEIPYLVGTMIELPRAALTADQVARVAEFFSYGTNDLTQTTFGLSRDDAQSFLPNYAEMEILADDPFQTIDLDGVGQLVEISTERGRRTRPDLKVGICGEHGGDPKTVHFCHKTGLNYVSCSPFRLPIARLAAAQATLEELDKKAAPKKPGKKKKKATKKKPAKKKKVVKKKKAPKKKAAKKKKKVTKKKRVTKKKSSRRRR
jgi:pyruvate,orthophosphate dikinase